MDDNNKISAEIVRSVQHDAQVSVSHVARLSHTSEHMTRAASHGYPNEPIIGPLIAKPIVNRDEIHSFPPLREDAQPALALPTVDHIPGASFALSLSNTGVGEQEITARFFHVESLRELNIVMNPLLEVHQNIGIALFEQVETLTLIFDQLKNIRSLFLVIEHNLNGWQLALEQLEHCLQNIEIVVLEIILEAGSNVFVFNFKLVGDKIGAINYFLEKLPFSPNNDIDYCWERCFGNPYGYILIEAIIAPSDDLVEKYRDNPCIRWSIGRYSTYPFQRKNICIVDLDCGGVEKKSLFLHRYPRLRKLNFSAPIRMWYGEDHLLIESLKWSPVELLSIDQCCLDFMPNLQRLELSGLIKYDKPLNLAHFPKLNYLHLESVENDAEVKMDGIPFSFKIVYLRNFRGIVSGVEKISIERLYVHGFVKSRVFIQMSKVAACVDIEFDRYSKNNKQYDIVFKQMKSLKFNCLIPSYSGVPSRFNLNSLASMFVLSRLNIDNCLVSLSPQMFPNLQELRMKSCEFRFCYDEDDSEYEEVSFDQLVSLSISLSVVLPPTKQNGDVGCIIKAPKLEKLDLQVVSPLSSVKIDHLSCPELKDFFLDTDEEVTIPFDFRNGSGPLFPKLQSISLFKTSCERSMSSVKLQQLFSIDRIEKLQLMDGVEIADLNELQLSCQFANLSSSALGVHKGTTNVKRLSELKIFTLKMALNMMPFNKFLMIDRELLNFCMLPTRKKLQKQALVEFKEDRAEEGEREAVDRHSAAKKQASCEGLQITGCHW